MTDYIISVYVFFLMFAIAYFVPKYNDILFMVRLDKNLSKAEPFCRIVYRFRKQCFTASVILSAACPFMETSTALRTPNFFISLGLSLYLFIVFALYLTASREVIKERLAYTPKKNDIAETAKSEPICEIYHYLLHLFLVVKLIHFTLTLPYEYISISMIEYPFFSVIVLMLALIAERKFTKQKLLIYFVSLFMITSFCVIQQAFLSA